jgi:hypothetical protein
LDTTSEIANTACGYAPSQTVYGLPINYNSDAAQRRDLMKAYNEQIFTSTVVPGVYDRVGVTQNDATTSNLGISFQQQFPYMEISRSPYNLGEGLLVNESAVAPSTGGIIPNNVSADAKPAEVYDPRSYGYGTDYRSYVEPVTGQPRFFYDDVDAVRQTNYLTRNNIDVFPFGTSISHPAMVNGVYGDADAKYTESVINQRTELQQRLMHKNNARRWQLRAAPIHTNNTAAARGGTMGSGSNYSGPRGG